MLFDNLPLSMPWYSSIRLQDRFRKNVAVNAKIVQLAPNNGILPFQIRKNASSELPIEWVVKCCALDATLTDYDNGYTDATVADMSAYIFDCFMTTTLDGFDVLTFLNRYNTDVDPLGSARLGEPLPAGIYYMQASFSDAVWTSELFRVPQDGFTWDQPDLDCNYLCLKWYHGCDISPIHYTGNTDHLFYNLLYFDTFITATEPEFDEEVKEDGMNESFPTFKKVVVKYSVALFVPDFLKVALYVMKMHDSITIFTERKLRQGDLKNLEVSHTVEADGAYSTTELLFEQISLLVNVKCCDNMDLPVEEGVASPTLATEFCEPTGDILVQTSTFTAGFYGELWGKIGPGPYVLIVRYISRTNLIAGWSGNIGVSTGYTTFKVNIRQFTFVSGFTAPSVPTASC